MGMQRKIGAGIQMQAWQPFGSEPPGFGSPFATQLRKQERPCRNGKGWKDSCWWARRRGHVVLD